jgi:hypothetical protein
MARKLDVSGINAALRRCAAELYSAIELELGYPDQSDIRQRIETIERGARAVRQALDGSNLILDPILRGRRGDLPHEREGLAMLRELAKRISLFKKQKPPRRGRPKSFRIADDQPDARERCALIVGLHWQKEFGRWPGQRNENADHLCEQLWRYAGGAAHAEQRSEPFWRPYLKCAQQFQPPHAAGECVLRALSGQEPGHRLVKSRD